MITREIEQRLPTVRQLPLIAVGMYVLALGAWMAILWQWIPMPGGEMDMQMSDPGVPEAMAMGHGPIGVGLYLLMWGTMMIAMMYPSTVPLFRLYTGTLQEMSTLAKATRVSALLGVYTLVWTSTGLIPLAVNTVVPLAPLASDHRSLLLGGVLLVLGGYQLSSYKYQCLDKCRSPFGFLMTYHRPGIRGAAMMGLRFSLFCVGCCWALFAFMVAAGSMNILWMAIIALVLSLERTVSWGPRLAKAVGVVAGVAGVTFVVATMV
jgi:predicted metal-binding membrane protein